MVFIHLLAVAVTQVAKIVMEVQLIIVLIAKLMHNKMDHFQILVHVLVNIILIAILTVNYVVLNVIYVQFQVNIVLDVSHHKIEF